MRIAIVLVVLVVNARADPPNAGPIPDARWRWELGGGSELGTFGPGPAQIAYGLCVRAEARYDRIALGASLDGLRINERTDPTEPASWAARSSIGFRLSAIEADVVNRRGGHERLDVWLGGGGGYELFDRGDVRRPDLEVAFGIDALVRNGDRHGAFGVVVRVFAADRDGLARLQATGALATLDIGYGD